MGGNTLNEGESHMVYSSAGGQVKSTAVARLYMSQGNSWAYSHLWGAAALVAVDGDAGAHYIRLVDLQSGQVTWEQELYDRFEYQSATPFFHTFEGNDAVIGLSFADESDAATFHHAVASFGSAAGRAPSSATNIQQPSSGGGSMIGGQQSAFAGTASGGGSKRMANPKQKKKGWFSRITEKMGLGEDEGNQDIVLSGPTGFRHESHIGWDPSNGFEIRNIPPEWRKLFQAAGVKKSELRDANTAKFIMDTVAEATMGANPMAGPMPGGGPPPPPVPGHRPPPPAPGAPPPPPAPSAPPPPPAFSAPAAPPPPSFGGGGGPGAPPPPPPDKAMSFGSSLADQLASAQLKSADDRSVPDLAGLNEEQSSTLADTLAKAMAARRVDMRADEDELDSDDEWSD